MTSSYDRLIRSQRIYTNGEWFDGFVGIRDGRIASLIEAGPAPEAHELVDVGEKPVIPGLIDTHVHLRDPGFTDKEDFETGTRAAAAGGVTTVFDMPNVDPPPNTVERFRAHLANAATKSLVDFGHNASGTIPDEIRGLAAAGASAFKVFMMTDIGRDYPHMPGTAVSDHGTLLRICEEVAATGLPLYVHPHDQSLYEIYTQRAWQEWGRDYRSYARAWRSGDGVVLDSGIATMLELQRATGVRLHILHMSTIHGFEMVRMAKQAGRAVTIELNPHSLFVTNTWEAIERLGPYCLGMWVPEAHAAATWEALVDGSADVIATDHSPHTKEEKELGWSDMYAAPGGSPMIQHYLGLLLDAVNKGRATLERVIDLCAANPARLTGLYPRKGVIAPGADADLVVLDMDRVWVVRASESYYKCGWTPLEGLELRGAPTMTMLRGNVIARDGEVLAAPGQGRFVNAPVQSPQPK
jgi:dihydroorotase